MHICIHTNKDESTYIQLHIWLLDPPKRRKGKIQDMYLYIYSSYSNDKYNYMRECNLREFASCHVSIMDESQITFRRPQT